MEESKKNKNCELIKIYSQRGRVLMLKDRFKFSKYGGLQSGETGWKCVEKSCRAKLYTIGEECRLSRETGVHVHSPLDENVIMRQAISNRLKRKSTECLSEKPSKLVDLELSIDENAMTKLTSNDIKLIKDNMYHARAKKKQNKTTNNIINIIQKNDNNMKLNYNDDNEEVNNINNTAETTLTENNQQFSATNNQSLPLQTTNSSKKKRPKFYNYDYEYENGQWPDWICNIRPHFLATDLINEL